MVYEDVCAYVNAMDAIQAKEMIQQMTVADWPHLSKEKRRKIHQDIYKMLNSLEESSKKPMTLEDLAKYLGAVNGKRAR